MKKILSYFTKNFKIEKKNIASFIVFLLVIGGVMLLMTTVFSTIAPTVFIVALSVMFIFMFFMAGIVVFRSLFLISGGLSLMIFLAQAYCMPEVIHNANSSMQSIFGFSIFYLVFLFLKSLYLEIFGGKDGDKEIKGHMQTLKEIYNGKIPWFLLGLYAGSMGIFLLQLYAIFKPIFGGLCIYQ